MAGDVVLTCVVGTQGACSWAMCACPGVRSLQVVLRWGLRVAVGLCCSTACELRTVLRSHDERSAVRSSQAAEQHSWSAIRCSPSLTKPGPAGQTDHDDWLVQASATVLAVGCLQPALARKLPTDVYLALS